MTLVKVPVRACARGKTFRNMIYRELRARTPVHALRNRVEFGHPDRAMPARHWHKKFSKTKIEIAQTFAALRA